MKNIAIDDIKQLHPVLKENNKTKLWEVIGVPVLSCLIALQDNAKFIYTPKSFKDGALDGSPRVYRERILILQKGTIVLFHPLLLHAGAGYGAEANTRLHLYIIPKNYELSKDKQGYVLTYFHPEVLEVPRDVSRKRQKTS
jgi:hypothetical protein